MDLYSISSLMSMNLRKYHKNIIEKWVKFFVLKQSVRSTNIKKKL